ncbi:N-acetylmuramoyl-L-alanine amidase [Ktedonobacter racemifer]|uniref:N-acetylmuramoyl-L-alanine amidase n=1 Tax=Ktedonobacter racemifer DSM 44963 TaxID=485913 RepID=D6TUI2_KTERA|nr:peptidoglycan recognition family protein [Ktedonobacter racemifer]EFH84050.1 N-acetylmuramyl-L-alanine amidase, negative regulator of AmpC, AmpD [Ktedonobacter racemifer DSM 44963]
MNNRILWAALKTLMGLSLLLTLSSLSFSHSYAASSPSVNQAFQQASHETGVPVPLLQALCYMEGRLSMHDGTPSIDQGYGCMHLVKNKRQNTLDQAAQDLHVSTSQLQNDLVTNIRGGAAILRQNALKLSPTHTLPKTLADWADATALYSNATTGSTAQMYVDEVYRLLRQGFQARAENQELVTLAPQNVMAPHLEAKSLATATLPTGCSRDGNVEYPGAVDCIVNPTTFDCNVVSSGSPCTYESAKRPGAYSISDIVIHDIEGSAQDGLNVFQDPNSGVSIHYVVGGDGTVYQLLHEKDIAYHAGNYWYNQHTIGIEHAGFDATGYQWYNATEYLASAKLVAYLLNKYHISLEHDHILSHGTIPSPTLGSVPNHEDPGPYWLWPYYFSLIQQQGVAAAPTSSKANVVTVNPATGKAPYGQNGTETRANHTFFTLYTHASTASSVIPNPDNGSSTGVGSNVEARISYAYTSKVKDPAGTGDTLYQIWYGEQDPNFTPTHMAHAKQAWLAIPAGSAVENTLSGANAHVIKLTGKGSKAAQVSGRPTTSNSYYIGDAPTGATFVSAYSIVEDGTSKLWYEINYNHRQAFVPASAVTIVS